MSFTHRRRTGRVALCVIVLMCVAACQQRLEVRADDAAQQVSKLVSEQNDFTPTDVTCPDVVEPEVGTEFQCSFTGPEDTLYAAHMRVVQIIGEQVVFDIGIEPTQ
jgi:hypothetical protein